MTEPPPSTTEPPLSTEPPPALPAPGAPSALASPLTGRAWWLGLALVFIGTLAATAPTAGDLGLTFDEPAYRYSQQVSQQWWEQLAEARSADDLAALVEPDVLLYYWPYARHGINFHPPLSGQLNLLTYALFGGVLKDIPARRMANVLEYCLVMTLLFGFLARRYGPWVGLTAAGALLTMPRVYGQAHLIETDTPGMLLWLATALVFWKGVYEPAGRPWRVLVGVLLGLAFVQKMGAVLVAGPLLAWLVVARLPDSLRRGERAAWVDGLITSAALLVPLGLAFAEVRRLTGELPPPQYTDLFRNRPASYLPGAILLAPLGIWVVRELARRLFRGHAIWGVERPALETWAAILAFAPVVGWLGHPGWWRETLPRLAHYYMLSTARRDSLPEIQILYFGRIYDYALPWQSAWVLLAITVPATLLAAATVGVLYALRVVRSDRLPLFFIVLMATLPLMRIASTPAHDGVRLFLPTFAFLAGLVGWGTAWLADALTWAIRPVRRFWLRALVAATVLLPAAWALVRIHPYELSYYNTLIGGPRGAWDKGFELSYWYDAFTPAVIADLNDRLPRGAQITYANERSNPMMVLQDLQALGALRGDLRIWAPVPNSSGFPYMWLLTHDSKAMPFSRLLFVLRPWYAVAPEALDGLRVLSVYDPRTVARAWALQLLADSPAPPAPPTPPAAPSWVHRYAPWLGGLWGEDLELVDALNVNEAMLTWAEDDPDSLRAAARHVAEGLPDSDSPDARRLRAILTRYDNPSAGRDFSGLLLRTRPEAIIEAAEILIARGDAVRRALLHPPYTDPATLGGYLDQGINDEPDSDGSFAAPPIPPGS